MQKTDLPPAQRPDRHVELVETVMRMNGIARRLQDLINKVNGEEDVKPALEPDGSGFSLRKALEECPGMIADSTSHCISLIDELESQLF